MGEMSVTAEVVRLGREGDLKLEGGVVFRAG
jgi:hypothetical protein